MYQGREVYVMLSNPRLVPGHLLVIPRRHIEKPGELTESERKELFDTVLLFQEKIVTKLASGCDIRENYRPFVEQNRLKINHVHFHLIPRESNDEIYEKVEQFQKVIFRDLKENERGAIPKSLN